LLCAFFLPVAPAAAARDYTQLLQLTPGLSITFRVRDGIDTRMKQLGDYRFTINVDEVDDKGFKYDWQNSPPAAAAGSRTVNAADEQTSHKVSLFYFDRQKGVVLGTTNIVRVSDDLYKELKLGEATPFSLDGPEGRYTPEGGRSQIALPKTLQVTGTEPMDVWIGDKEVSVRALKAQTDNGWTYWIMDNARFPIMLAGTGPFFWGEPHFSGNIATDQDGAQNKAKRITDQLEKSGIATSYEILFAFDSDKLTERSKQILSDVGKYLADHPSLRILIEGHTDNVGGAVYNLNLSKRRSASVEHYLEQQSGIAADRLESAGRGYTRPVADNATAAGRAKNRRVVFKRM
ncbi:MAG TPA: OmpA family protein, partial [Candidatus Obscuribacterales bacterium]